METKTKLIIGFLILLISSSIIYVTFSDKAKIRVDEDKSTFYMLNENSRWVVAGREYNSIFDGTTKLNRDVSEIEVNTWNDSKNVWIQRVTPYIRGPVIMDTYEFDSSTSDIELFPISHTIEVFNGSGYFYKYEVKDLEYSGPTFKLDGWQTSQEFGKNMTVTWWKDYKLGWIYKSGSMYVKSEKLSDYEKFDVRLFDPEVDEIAFMELLTFDGDENITRHIKLDSHMTSVLFSIEGFTSNFSSVYSFESDYGGWTSTSGMSRLTNWSTRGGYSVYFDTVSASQSISKTIDLSNVSTILYDWDLTYSDQPGCAIYINDNYMQAMSDGLDKEIDVQNYYGEYDIKFLCYFGRDFQGPSGGYLDNIRFYDWQQVSYSPVFDNVTTTTFINLTGSTLLLSGANNNYDNNYTTGVNIIQDAYGDNYGWFNETWNTTGIDSPFFRIKISGDSNTYVSGWNTTDWIEITDYYWGNNASDENDMYTRIYNVSNYNGENSTNLKISIFAHEGTFGNIPLAQIDSKYYESDMGSISFSDYDILFPANPWLEIGTPDGDYEWNYSGNFSSLENVSDFSIEINTILNTCDCIGCYMYDSDCVIPFIFHSDTIGGLEYSSLNITYALPIFGVDLNAPIDNYSSSSIEMNFTCSAYHNYGNLKNLALYGNWTGAWKANLTNDITGYSNSTIFYQNISEGEYKWGCYACDDDDVCEWSSNRTFTIDTTPPLIEFGVGTEDNNSYIPSLYSNIYVNVSVVEEHENFMTFILINSSYTESAVVVNYTSSFDKQREINWTNLPKGWYDYAVACADYSGNTNDTGWRRINLLADFNVSLSPGMEFDFIPDNVSHQQVEPTNQTNETGILTLQNNLSYDFSLQLIFNDSFSNVTVWVNDAYNYSNATKINTTNYYEIMANFSNGSTGYLWMWADYLSPLRGWFPVFDIYAKMI